MRIFALAASFLFLLPISGSVRAQTVTAAHPEHIPTNDDVLLMVRFHASESKILDAINSSPKVNFDTTPDGVSKLASAGVSSTVIAAMMKRANGTPAETPSATQPSSAAPTPDPSGTAFAKSMGAMIPPDVTIHTKEGDTALSGRQGEYEFKYYVFAAMNFANYRGAASKFRTSDRKPSLIAHLDDDPKDKQESSLSYLVRLDPSTSKDQRSLKVGQAFKTGAGAADPDSDWTIPFDTVQESPGIWKITPTKDLKPGEYGLYVRHRLYDFGVDK